MSDLRKQIEALKRYELFEDWKGSSMKESDAGAYVELDEVLALLPHPLKIVEWASWEYDGE